MTIAKELSKYAVSLRYEDLNTEVVHQVKLRLIDSLACAYGAFNSKPGRVTRDVARTIRSDKCATVLGTACKTSPEMAAFANGTLVRCLDWNDTYLAKEPAHPSDNISAALAIAEAEQLTGKDLITAIVLAYEIQCRLCDAASLRKRGWDHVTYGAFSASLLASKLYGLDINQTRNALAIAVTTNNALRQTRVGTISYWKACAFANVARNGVFAATLAKHGLTGPNDVVEGEKGFWRQVSGEFGVDVSSFGGPETKFKVMDTDIKYHQAEYHAQSAVQAVLNLREREPIKVLVDTRNIQNIDRIVVTTFEAAKSIIADKEKWYPKTRETADHSLPYLVAVALMDGVVGPEQFTPERIDDSLLKSIMEKISVVEDKSFTELYPESNPNNINIILTDSSSYEERVDLPKGHSKNPMTDDEICEKFSRLTSSLIPEDSARSIISSILKLEELDDIAELNFNHIIEE